MSKFKSLRAADQIHLSDYKRKDFATRKYGFFSKKTLLVSVIISILMITSLSTFLLYIDSLLGAQICLWGGILLYIYTRQIDRYKVTLERTEFLNGMFASALGSGSKFCTMVRQSDGQIIYINRGFQLAFPDMIITPLPKLDALFKLYKTSSSHDKSILQAIKANKAKDIAVKIETGDDKKPRSMVVSVEPIARPNGFCLIRGREKA